MKPKHVVTVAKTGAIYIPKLTTKYLGIFGWAGVVIAVEKTYIYMRFYKHSITPIEGELVVKLQKKSGGRQAMTGGCRKFSEAIKSDFGDSNYLDLHIKTMFADEESVRISFDRPSRKDEEPTPECEEKAEANEDETSKDAQAKVARWIKANGCGEVSCNGTKGHGRFEGVACPLKGQSGGCGQAKLKEMEAAEHWLVSNGYPLDQETSLGTISNPITEKQLDIFNLSRSKAGSSQRTRPLPEGLPEWLSGPFSRGEQVRVAIRVPGEKASQGWAIGIHSRFGKFSVAVADDTEYLTKVRLYHPKYIFQSHGTLKPAVECYKIAGKLGIGLSALQIEAVNSGGVPPEGHGLPDEMFE
jgi:hypothetical protein